MYEDVCTAAEPLNPHSSKYYLLISRPTGLLFTFCPEDVMSFMLYQASVRLKSMTCCAVFVVLVRRGGRRGVLCQCGEQPSEALPSPSSQSPSQQPVDQQRLEPSKPRWGIFQVRCAQLSSAGCECFPLCNHIKRKPVRAG